MKIPQDTADKETFLRLIIDACMASEQERRALYEKRRRYFLYGQNQDAKVRFNRLKSHMKLVASFLFSPESLVFNVTPPKNATEEVTQKFLALQDDWNEDVHDSGIADMFAEGVLWGLNYDTMIGKIGWNDTTKQAFVELVEPSSFGVYREDRMDFTSQPAMNHSLLIDYDEACTRLTQAGMANRIPELKIEGQPANNDLPNAVNRLIITATGGENLMGNVMGNVNPDYEAGPLFRAKLVAPMTRWNETWVWDTDAEDYRIFHSFDGPILISDSADTVKILQEKGNGKVKFDSKTNWFLEKENPFFPITPFTLYNYFWGDCHQEDIIPLQNWSTKRLEEIDDVLEKQVDPDRAFIGFQGLADEKMGSFGDEGRYVADSMPGAKVEEFRPPMPPDLFREFTEIGALMMEASGLTEVVSGKSSGGARGGQQQKQMQITGGGQIRKIAIGLEHALVRMGELGLKLKIKNDDTKIKLPDGNEFVASQVADGYSMHVAGHSHSPLFTLETRELAQMLFKAQAIDREWLIRMLNPTESSNLIHSLRNREKAEAIARQQNPQPPAKGKK